MTDIHIGEVVRIATGIPATFDKAGYEAMTWVVINGMVEAPAFASTHSDIAIPSLATGRTTMRKGAEAGVASSLVFSTVAADAGQVAVVAASRARGQYSISVLNPAATAISYASGIIKDHAPNKPTTSSYDGSSFNFVPNYTAVDTTPP